MATNEYQRGLSMLSDEVERHRLSLEAADPGDEDDTEQSDRDRKTALVEQAIKRFQLCATAEMMQRQREEEDLKFDRALPEDQWPDSIRKDRSGGIGPDGFQVSERPCLVIPKLDQPVQQVVNEARNARIGVHIRPKSDGANQDGAELRQGLYRSIEQNSRANIARMWALDRAVKCGRGAYRVAKEFSNDGDFDIDIVIKRILNQATVYLDPFALEPDWSDGEWALLTSDIPVDEYKRRYPHSALNDISADKLQAIGDRVPGWIGGTDEDGESGRTIRVAEYYYVLHKKRTLVFIPNVGKKWLDELPEGTELPPNAKKRDVDIRTVKWCILNAEEVLEEEDWEGRYIPIIPVLGKEYNINGDRCFKGVISNSKDAQRSYNYMRSAQVEAVGLAPKAPYIMAEGQDEGYEAMWDQLNTRNYTRLKYKPIDFNGTTLPAPQRNVAEPAIQAISMAVNMADADIKSTTGRFDPSLGRARADQSGKAINLLKEAGESTTSNYLENLTAVSMYYEAKVILDLMPYVYDRPGRIVQVLGEEENDVESVMLNAPFIETPNGPQPAPPPGMLQRLSGLAGGNVKQPKNYDLSKGNYGVEITVGRSFATQREENAEMLRGIIEAAPGLTPMIADLLVEQLDTPIARRAAERLRKMNPQLQDEGEDAQVPPQVQAKLQALEEQHQMLTQALEAANAELKSQHYKVDVDAEVRRLEIDARLKVAQIQAQAQMATTQVKTQTDEEIALLKIRADQQEQSADQQHDRTMATAEFVASDAERTADQEHDKWMRGADLVGKASEDSRKQGHELRMSERDRQHEAGQGERDRQAKLTDSERQRQHDAAQRNRDLLHASFEAKKNREQEAKTAKKKDSK